MTGLQHQHQDECLDLACLNLLVWLVTFHNYKLLLKGGRQSPSLTDWTCCISTQDKCLDLGCLNLPLWQVMFHKYKLLKGGRQSPSLTDWTTGLVASSGSVGVPSLGMPECTGIARYISYIQTAAEK